MPSENQMIAVAHGCCSVLTVHETKIELLKTLEVQHCYSVADVNETICALISLRSFYLFKKHSLIPQMIFCASHIGVQRLLPLDLNNHSAWVPTLSWSAMAPYHFIIYPEKGQKCKVWRLSV